MTKVIFNLIGTNLTMAWCAVEIIKKDISDYLSMRMNKNFWHKKILAWKRKEKIINNKLLICYQ